MNFDEYARTAVDLVNAEVDTLERARAFYGSQSWQAAELTERDVTVLRKGAKRLREIFESGSAGRDEDAVAALNALLEAHPVQPRISAHSANDWHMHVTGRGASVGAEHMAGAVWGLAVWLCEYGSARFGVCADDRCGNVYLDTSSNCCRRFCSERCATRSHVAAHRARKRAVADSSDSNDSADSVGNGDSDGNGESAKNPDAIGSSDSGDGVDSATAVGELTAVGRA